MFLVDAVCLDCCYDSQVGIDDCGFLISLCVTYDLLAIVGDSDLI